MAILEAVTGIEIDATRFRATMAAYARVMGMAAGKVVKAQAALFASDLLNYTLPVEGNGGGRKGVTLAAKGIGEGTLERDVYSIFKPLHEASYEEIAGQGDYSVFAAWITDNWAHQKRTGSIRKKDVNPEGWAKFQADYGGSGSGKADFSGVNKGESFIRTTHVAIRGGTSVKNYGFNVKKNKKTYFIDGAESKIPAYLKEAKKRVGRLKSGWAEAARALGKKPESAAWIDRNQSGTGYAVDESSDSDKPAVTIANRIHFLMGQGAGTTLWKYAGHYRAYAMRAVIARILTRKAGGSPQRLEHMIRDLELPLDEYQLK